MLPANTLHLRCRDALQALEDGEPIAAEPDERASAFHFGSIAHDNDATNTVVEQEPKIIELDHFKSEGNGAVASLYGWPSPTCASTCTRAHVSLQCHQHRMCPGEETMHNTHTPLIPLHQMLFSKSLFFSLCCWMIPFLFLCV